MGVAGLLAQEGVADRWCVISAISVYMSLPNSRAEALEPLLPAAKPSKPPKPNRGIISGKMSVTRRRSDSEEEDDLGGGTGSVQIHSFASEPFHRFGAEQQRRAAQWPAAGAGSAGGIAGGSEERFAGAVDGESDPDVVAFAGNQLAGPSSGPRGSQGSGGQLMNSIPSAINVGRSI